MPLFDVTLWEKVTYTLEDIEADNEEEAIEIAEETYNDVEGVSQGFSARTVSERE